jgi:apolipoprotein N-acyltransferase
VADSSVRTVAPAPVSSARPGHGSRRSVRDRLPIMAACIGAGLLMAFSLPPWGWWPLLFVGIFCLDRLIAGQPAASRFWRGWLVAAAWLFPGMGWMVFMSAPGWGVAVAVYSAYFGAACAIAPASRWRWVVLPGSIALAEVLRWAWPFGGVPLASFAISQAVSPFAFVVRVGGAPLLVMLAVTVGVVLAAAWERAWTAVGVGVAAIAVVIAFASVAPRGNDTGTLDVALVQGGGPQGTRASNTDERVVFERHLEATGDVALPVDLVVWPENVVHVEGPVGETTEGAELAELARSLGGATLAVGVIEGDGADHFHNSQVAYDETGAEIDRYEKVRRVPFGEWMPLRELLDAIGAPTDLVPRDAAVGASPATLDTPAGRLGVVISWEVFFGGRARDAIGNGGTVLLNPTNGASYNGTILQTQQINASRLRALETGRWVAQVAPTGFTAFLDDEGNLLQRSGVSERRVLQTTVTTRSGDTLYVRWGDPPVVALALLLVAIGLIGDRARASRSLARR